MSSAGSPLWTKTVAVGILSIAAVIGNVSLSASRPTQNSPHYPGKDPHASLGQMAPSDPQVLLTRSQEEQIAGLGYSNFGYPDSRADDNRMPLVPEPDDGSTPDDSGQVVPAIYAWDPDVRFVFYRHVSKWI